MYSLSTSPVRHYTCWSARRPPSVSKARGENRCQEGKKERRGRRLRAREGKGEYDKEEEGKEGRETRQVEDRKKEGNDGSEEGNVK